MAAIVGTTRLDMPALSVTQAKTGHWGLGWASCYLTTTQAIPYIASFSIEKDLLSDEFSGLCFPWPPRGFFCNLWSGLRPQSGCSGESCWCHLPLCLPCGASCFPAAPWCLSAFSQEVLKNVSQTVGLACWKNTHLVYLCSKLFTTTGHFKIQFTQCLNSLFHNLRVIFRDF